MPWPPVPQLPAIRIQPLSRGLPSFASFRLPAGERLLSSAHQGPVNLPRRPGAPQNLCVVAVSPKLLHLVPQSGGLREETPPGILRDQIGVVGSSSPPGTCQSIQLGRATAGMWPFSSTRKEGRRTGDPVAWRGAEVGRPRVCTLWLCRPVRCGGWPSYCNSTSRRPRSAALRHTVLITAQHLELMECRLS